MKLGGLLFLLLLSLTGQAQNRAFYAGLFPEAAVTGSVNQNWQLTFKVESQHGSFDNRQREGQRWDYFHNQTDLQGFVARKLNPFWKVSGGYQYRLEGGGGTNTHRTIQQVALVQRLRRVRLGHRVRTDQTYYPGDATEWRGRYRLSAEIPLVGEELDPGELYWLLSNELIYSHQGGDNEVENRLVSSLGRYFSPKVKLEAGLDYRTDRYVAEGFRQRLWLKVGAYINI